MNKLSLMIYLTDVAGSLGGSFTALFVISIICTISGAIMASPQGLSEPSETAWAIWRKWVWTSGVYTE